MTIQKDAFLPCSYQIQVIHELHDKIPTYEDHAYHNSKALVAIQGIYGININLPESGVTCRFQYHLHSLHCILPYLAAFGSNCYIKSVTLYFEKLYNFEPKHPEMYTTYLGHGDTVRRSDRLWGWLSLNLCTGHGMMRIIKSAGGLSHCNKVLMSFSEPFSCSQHTSLVQCPNTRTDRGDYEIIRSTPLCMSVNAYLGQRWFAERHQLHWATQSLAACAFCPNTLTLLLMQRRYLYLIILIIHKLLGRPSWQISSREKGKSTT